METLTIAMLGPRGVGKTSLLTSMYESFGRMVGEADLQLTPAPQTGSILSRQLGELRKLFAVFAFDTHSVIRTPSGEAIQGIRGTNQVTIHEFGLGKKGKKPSLRLNFVDYPGGYLDENAKEEERTFLRNLIENSHAILVAIDAPSLVEAEGAYNETRNATTTITVLFQNYYQELAESRLVIFAPIRSEKYMSEPAGAARLQAAFEREYRVLLDLFQSESLRETIAVVITPVQTLGSFVFYSLEEEDESLKLSFRKKTREAVYDPKDNEQPLRYVLRFLLKIHHSNRATSLSIFSFLRKWFKMDVYLTRAVTIFAQKCNKGGGFKIVQGEHLLDIDA